MKNHDSEQVVMFGGASTLHPESRSNEVRRHAAPLLELAEALIMQVEAGEVEATEAIALVREAGRWIDLGARAEDSGCPVEIEPGPSASVPEGLSVLWACTPYADTVERRELLGRMTVGLEQRLAGAESA